ncbi:MAG: hypothetical protein H8E33_01275 [Candidatus Cloacimonetes bacterium]|nr:hypothetical protein [Candidatus Cloacimonadota bacterium]MBL7108063.1 hypothetical protein [Candidatus Cloacimonadota bacterium]
METKEIFEKVKSEVSRKLSKIAGKTEYIAKISKLKFEITSRKSAMKDCYRQIGTYIYGKKKDFSKDDFLVDLFKEIDKLSEKNDSTLKKIDELKEAEKKSKTEKKED